MNSNRAEPPIVYEEEDFVRSSSVSADLLDDDVDCVTDVATNSEIAAAYSAMQTSPDSCAAATTDTMIDVNNIAETGSHSDTVCDRNIDNPGPVPDMWMTRSPSREMETTNNEVPDSSTSPAGGAAAMSDDGGPRTIRGLERPAP